MKDHVDPTRADTICAALERLSRDGLLGAAAAPSDDFCDRNVYVLGPDPAGEGSTPAQMLATFAPLANTLRGHIRLVLVGPNAPFTRWDPEEDAHK